MSREFQFWLHCVLFFIRVLSRLLRERPRLAEEVHLYWSDCLTKRTDLAWHPYISLFLKTSTIKISATMMSYKFIAILTLKNT